MTTRQAFLRSIRESPDDDVPRLVFADWLDENGADTDRARAQLIRLQIEQERLVEDDPTRAILDRQINDLAKAHQSAWLPKFPPGCHPVREGRAVGCGLPFRRGFIERIKASAQAFLGMTPDLFDKEPIVAAELGDFGGRYKKPSLARAVADSPLLLCLRTLDLREDSSLDEDAFGQLIMSLNLRNLRKARLSFSKVRARAARALAEAEHLADLEELCLACLWECGTLVLSELANRSRFRQLKRLVLESNGVGSEGMKALSSSTLLQNLTTLTLEGDCSPRPRIGNSGLEALASSSHLKQLRRLDIEYQDITEEGAIDLARSGHFTHLRHLRIEANLLGPGGVAALAGSDGFPNLERLELIGCGCGDDGLAALARGKGLPALSELVLSGSNHLGPFSSNDIGAAGLCALASSPLLSRLTRLELGDNKRIGAAGGKALAQADIPAKLEYLNLDGGNIGDTGAKALARSPHLSRLRKLGISRNDLHAAGVRAIIDSPHLRQLVELRFGGNSMRKSNEKSLIEEFESRR